MSIQFEVETTEYVAPTQENPFTDVVAQHVKNAEKNPAIANVITVPAKDEGKAKLFYQKAANAIGKTAKIKGVDDSGVTVTGQTPKGRDIREGNVKITFVIGEKHKARRGDKSE